jgi:hypothetical protein
VRVVLGRDARAIEGQGQRQIVRVVPELVGVDRARSVGRIDGGADLRDGRFLPVGSPARLNWGGTKARATNVGPTAMPMVSLQSLNWTLNSVAVPDGTSLMTSPGSPVSAACSMSVGPSACPSVAPGTWDASEQPVNEASKRIEASDVRTDMGIKPPNANPGSVG